MSKAAPKAPKAHKESAPATPAQGEAAQGSGPAAPVRNTEQPVDRAPKLSAHDHTHRVQNSDKSKKRDNRKDR